MCWLKTSVFLFCLIPCVRACWLFFYGDLVNPIEFVLHASGTWALIGLLATLALTPLRWLSRWGFWLRLRRLLGLFAFFYAVLHVGLYVILDQELVWDQIGPDFLRRPFMMVGLVAFLLLLPLALTSTDGWMRRLKRHWKTLHRLIYCIAILAVVHDWMQVKRDITQPAIYAVILAVLLLFRIGLWLQRQRR